jgi:hypothetical protein
VKTAHAAIAVAVITAGCATRPSNPASTDATNDPGPAKTIEVDVAEINRLRCDPVVRAGTRIVIGERCYPVGRRTVDEEALAEQLEQVRRDQEELDRRRREAEERRGPGL